MKTETIVVVIDIARQIKSESRVAFSSMPRPQRIANRKHKSPKYKIDFRKDDHEK